MSALGAFGPRLWETVMLLTISYLESAYPITPVSPLKPCFCYNFEICLLFTLKIRQDPKLRFKKTRLLSQSKNVPVFSLLALLVFPIVVGQTHKHTHIQQSSFNCTSSSVSVASRPELTHKGRKAASVVPVIIVLGVSLLDSCKLF